MKLRQIAAGILGMTAALSLAAAADKDPGASPGESLYYGGDEGAKHYSPLDQITASNVQNLKVAWRHAGVDPKIVETYPKLKISNNLRSTPLMIHGTLYVSNGIGLVEAMDPATGKTLWTQEPVGAGIEGMQKVSRAARSRIGPTAKIRES